MAHWTWKTELSAIIAAMLKLLPYRLTFRSHIGSMCTVTPLVVSFWWLPSLAVELFGIYIAAFVRQMPLSLSDTQVAKFCIRPQGVALHNFGPVEVAYARLQILLTCSRCSYSGLPKSQMLGSLNNAWKCRIFGGNVWFETGARRSG